MALPRPRRSAVRPPKPNQSPIAVSKAAPSSPEPTAKRRNVLAFELVPTPAASSEVRSAAARAVALPVYNYGSPQFNLAQMHRFSFSRRRLQNAALPDGDSSSLAALPFRDAARRWIESRDSVLRGRTGKGYKHHISQLNKFFGHLRLEEIYVGHLIAYQEARTENEKALEKEVRSVDDPSRASRSAANDEASQRVVTNRRSTPALPMSISKKKKALDHLRSAGCSHCDEEASGRSHFWPRSCHPTRWPLGRAKAPSP